MVYLDLFRQLSGMYKKVVNWSLVNSKKSNLAIKVSYLAFIYISRFLWDAHNCEESLDEEELGVSTNYLNHWNDLVDLWYLGMQVLANLLTQVLLESNYILLRLS